MSRPVWRRDSFRDGVMADDLDGLEQRLVAALTRDFGLVQVNLCRLDLFRAILRSAYEQGARRAERVVQADRLAEAKHQVGLTLSALVESLPPTDEEEDHA